MSEVHTYLPGQDRRGARTRAARSRTRPASRDSARGTAGYGPAWRSLAVTGQLKPGSTSSHRTLARGLARTHRPGRPVNVAQRGIHRRQSPRRLRATKSEYSTRRQTPRQRFPRCCLHLISTRPANRLHERLVLTEITSLSAVYCDSVAPADSTADFIRGGRRHAMSNIQLAGACQAVRPRLTATCSLP